MWNSKPLCETISNRISSMKLTHGKSNMCRTTERRPTVQLTNSMDHNHSGKTSFLSYSKNFPAGSLPYSQEHRSIQSTPSQPISNDIF